MSPQTRQRQTARLPRFQQLQMIFLFRRDFFGKSPELLQRLSECSEENPAMADLLVALFDLPTRHLHEYSRLLLKLATCFEVVGGGFYFQSPVFRAEDKFTKNDS